jgi:methylenetetrahydrofolate dehydrogenase (NADP+)/methenyltetrahydrofolate cyclohydrolase
VRRRETVVRPARLAQFHKIFFRGHDHRVFALSVAFNVTQIVVGKHAVIVGRSNIVGKPLAMMLLNRDATVTICHSKTKNLKELTLQADILVAAVGSPDIITADMVKPGAVVIDVGTSRNAEGKIAGDVDFDAVQTIASAITPVPGGVGPMTVASLIRNCVRAKERQQGDERISFK